MRPLSTGHVPERERRKCVYRVRHGALSIRPDFMRPVPGRRISTLADGLGMHSVLARSDV